MLNIQPLVVRLPSHSSSSKCAEGKVYNVKISFVQTIIPKIDTIGTSAVEFLCRSRRHWHVREQTRLGATSMDLVFIEDSLEDEVEEHHFVET